MTYVYKQHKIKPIIVEYSLPKMTTDYRIFKIYSFQI